MASRKKAAGRATARSASGKTRSSASRTSGKAQTRSSRPSGRKASGRKASGRKASGRKASAGRAPAKKKTAARLRAQSEEPKREPRRRAATATGHSSAASGRATGALRSTASVRGRHEADEALEARSTRSARRGGPGPGRTRARAEEPEHVDSPTAVAAEALRTGVVPNQASSSPDDEAIPGAAGTLQVGDPDAEPMRNEYEGEQVPGASTPTPDQSNVDEIGRAYGVQEEDSGELRTSSEMLDRRDRRQRGLGVRRRKT